MAHRGAQKRKSRREQNQTRRNEEIDERIQLKTRLEAEAPARGYNPLAEKLRELDPQDAKTLTTARKFTDLPLSQRTQKGLLEAKFKRMTSIQHATLPHALTGRDVLGAAKTGSGKTLAFLIPVLETLWHLGWSQLDGLGAMIISPTRELALQTFEVLRAIGKYHTDLSAGLVIGGGKFIKDEQARISKMNIIVCTPGRLLQHLDSTPDFRCDGVQIVVLDEADRILDQGFEKSVNAIIGALPMSRQTLLFSATQSAAVSQLSRLALKEPEFISVHAESQFTTPAKLAQFYLKCQLKDKINILWSFLRTHKRQKMIIFLSSQKQVRFIYEAFKKLSPGLTLLHIHGKMSQNKRMKIYWTFHEKTGGVALFATDIAARGLDFKSVNWVLQVDCPESADTYIHRVGRTARMNKGGSSLLFLTESEGEIVNQLEKKRIPLEVIEINPTKQESIQASLQEVLLQDEDLKILAQKAIRSYVRALTIGTITQERSNDLNEEALADYARSLGLVSIPRLKILESRRADKNISVSIAKIKRLEGAIQQAEEEALALGTSVIVPLEKAKVIRSKADKLLKRKPQKSLSESALKFEPQESQSSDLSADGEDVLMKKSQDPLHLKDLDAILPAPSKVKKYKDKGPSINDIEGQEDSKVGFYEEAEKMVAEMDHVDRAELRARLKEKRLKIKSIEKEKEHEKHNYGNLVTIGSPEEHSASSVSEAESSQDKGISSEEEEASLDSNKNSRKRSRSDSHSSRSSKKQRTEY